MLFHLYKFVSFVYIFLNYNIFNLGAAGGLTKLLKMPACNLLVLGAKKTTLSGFSQVSSLPHTGFIYYADIVQEAPAVRKLLSQYQN